MRKYVRKTQTKWNENNLRCAMNAVLNKEMGYQKASKQFNIPKTTLIRYIKKFKAANQVRKKYVFL